MVPSDITIRGNHLFKPMSWANGKWTVGTTFQLKNARRVLFEGNVLENHWADAHVGYAIVFTAVNQGGTAPWSKVHDVTVRNNLISNAASGVNLLSRYHAAPNFSDEPSKRILIRNNLFLNVGRDPVAGQTGPLLQVLHELEDVTIAQNTFFGAAANSAVQFDGLPNKRLMLLNNVFGATRYGVMGDGTTGDGVETFTKSAPGSIVQGNVFTGLDERRYPSRNAFPVSFTSSDFVNSAGGNFTLRSSLRFSISGGALVGVDGAALLNATAGVVSR
jgi:hypothetical protein